MPCRTNLTCSYTASARLKTSMLCSDFLNNVPNKLDGRVYTLHRDPPAQHTSSDTSNKDVSGPCCRYICQPTFSGTVRRVRKAEEETLSKMKVNGGKTITSNEGSAPWWKPVWRSVREAENVKNEKKENKNKIFSFLWNCLKEKKEWFLRNHFDYRG